MAERAFIIGIGFRNVISKLKMIRASNNRLEQWWEDLSKGRYNGLGSIKGTQ